ncbi:hypothetical protein A2U01_0059984 [Trifolium medium]|uniref:Uncharacterized protein n=1 Tax=Trifolium medium TaxID=97028 RepID=A0A392RT31_9FABA|nr:hypothetical protein [Trifolium medium]
MSVTQMGLSDAQIELSHVALVGVVVAKCPPAESKTKSEHSKCKLGVSKVEVGPTLFFS